MIKYQNEHIAAAMAKTEMRKHGNLMWNMDTTTEILK